MRFFTTLSELLNDRVVGHALRLDKLRTRLGRVDGLEVRADVLTPNALPEKFRHVVLAEALPI
jgi:hypothetical protein